MAGAADEGHSVHSPATASGVTFSVCGGSRTASPCARASWRMLRVGQAAHGHPRPELPVHHGCGAAQRGRDLRVAEPGGRRRRQHLAGSDSADLGGRRGRLPAHHLRRDLLRRRAGGRRSRAAHRGDGQSGRRLLRRLAATARDLPVVVAHRHRGPDPQRRREPRWPPGPPGGTGHRHVVAHRDLADGARHRRPREPGPSPRSSARPACSARPGARTWWARSASA